MQKIFPLFLFIFLLSCGGKPSANGIELSTVPIYLKNRIPIAKTPDVKDTLPVKMATLDHPSITGDFNGDSIPETISTKLYSKRDKKWIKEVPEDCEMGCMCEYEPVLWLQSDNPEIPKLYLGTHTWQIYGISKLTNVGDINHDGKDEMAIIVNWADYSSMNTCDIYTLCNGKWKMIFDFGISEHALYNYDSGEQKDGNDLRDYFKQKDSLYYYHELQPAGDVWKRKTSFKTCN